MKYIFINPVVDGMYIKEALNEALLKKGYKRVEVEKDWHKLVKEKYDESLKQTNLTVLDKRCPKAVDTAKPHWNKEKILLPSIEPILIYCAVELANREDLKGHKKVITTPCESLASYGNCMKLENTEFISWKEFLKQLDPTRELQLQSLTQSPIPPGYFQTLEAQVTSISGKENIEAYFKTNAYTQDEIVEMLYCHQGCHNGDGVLMDE